MASERRIHICRRNGVLEPIQFDKVQKRLQLLGSPVGETINRPDTRFRQLDCDFSIVTQQVIARIYDGITTSELDSVAADVAISLLSQHPDYGWLSSRILITRLHKETKKSVLATFRNLHANANLADDVYEVIKKNAKQLEAMIDYNDDFSYDYFAVKTLFSIYLTKCDGKVVERPQHMLLRVALGLWKDNLPMVEETYRALSRKLYTHASPTIFNSGLRTPQLSSCFLLGVDDSVEGLFRSFQQSAMISKYAGGIGVAWHDVRSTGSKIQGTNGVSDGIIPFLKVLNATMRAVNQGGRRAGSAAVYLEPSHPDIVAFLRAKKNHGAEEERARDLFYALWIPDLFFKRVEAGATWSLFDPSACPGLSDVYGEEYEILYERYEQEAMYASQMPAVALFEMVIVSMIETGTPYLLAKDACNQKSNQKNVGTIKCSNLCSEIVEYSSPNEIAVCLTGDTEVMTEEGVRLLRDFVRRCKVVSAYSDDNIDSHSNPKQSQLYVGGVRLLDNGLKPVVQIGLKGTRPIRATDNHKFLVMHSHGRYIWKRTDRLRIGDRIAMPQLECLPKYKSFHNVIARYANIGWSAAETPDSHLPDNIRTSDPATIASCLTGFFSSAGEVHVIQGRPTVITMLSSTKMSLLYDAQSLLRCFGVNCKCFESHSTCFLVICSRNDLMRFRKHIGFALCDKKEKQLNDAMVGIEESVRPRPVASWATVIGLTRAGLERVYDLHVPVTHNFIANGIVTHNCTLASISLPAFVKTHPNPNVHQQEAPQDTDEHQQETPPEGEQMPWFDYDALHDTVELVTRNLNRVIDVGYLPLHEARYSNGRHRPIGIGTQGLADTFALMRLPFDSVKAMELNRMIAETIYHASVTQSMELAKSDGVYDTFPGSPASQGILQFDMWKVMPSDRYDWPRMRTDVQKFGLRNSLLVAHMPTASTSQLLNNTETNEPFTSMIFKRQTLSGEHVVINRHLVTDLMKLGVWTIELKDSIVANDGSVQHLRGVVPQEILDLYRTVWEIKQRVLIDMAAARGPYVCQSQSMNLFFASPNTVKFSSAIFHAWKSGLKTLVYYSRTKAATRAVPVTLKISRHTEEQQCLNCSA